MSPLRLASRLGLAAALAGPTLPAAAAPMPLALAAPELPALAQPLPLEDRLLLVRRGRGADDGAGHKRRGRGADDRIGHG